MMTKILRYDYYKDKIEANYLSDIHMAFHKSTGGGCLCVCAL